MASKVYKSSRPVLKNEKWCEILFTSVENGFKCQFMTASGNLLTFGQVLEMMQDFPLRFNALLRKSVKKTKFDAVFWECKPITKSTISKPFECVFLNAERNFTGKTKNHLTFREVCGNKVVCATPNRGGNGSTMLVIPECRPEHDFGHLANFVKSMEPDIQAPFWTLVAEQVRTKLDDKKKVFISTSGLAVNWLHVRIEIVPKYYNFACYKR